MQRQHSDVDQGSQGEHQHGGGLLLGELREHSPPPEAGAIRTPLRIAALGHACGCSQKTAKARDADRLKTAVCRVHAEISGQQQNQA